MHFKSNSILLAFDSSAFSAELNDFVFIPYLQNIQITNGLEKNSIKSLGKNFLDKKFYTDPDFNLSFSYIQEKAFLSEIFLGLYVNSYSSSDESILKKLIFNERNERAFAIFNENGSEDILYKIKNQGYSENLIAFSFANLYLNSYSISYSLGNLPIAAVNLTFEDFSVSNVLKQSTSYFVKDTKENNILLSDQWIESFFNKTNKNFAKRMMSSRMDFSISTNYSNLNIPSSNFDVLSSSNVQSIDFSINFEREKFFSFNSGNKPLKRNIIIPAIGKLSVQGFTSTFNKKSLTSLKNSDNKFYIELYYGVDNSSSGYSKIRFENITVDSFSYSISIDGVLNYSIECSIEVNEISGMKLTTITSLDDEANPSFIYMKSSDGSNVKTSDGLDLVVIA